MTTTKPSEIQCSCLDPTPKFKWIFDYLLLLLGISCVVAIAVVTTFLWTVQRTNELTVLQENLKNDLIVKDIEQIVRMVLKDVARESSPGKDYGDR